MLTLTIARLTLREASRRRLVRAFLLLTTAAIALTGWGFAELSRISVQGQLVTAVEVRLVAAPLLILVVFMFSFMLVLGAGFLSARLSAMTAGIVGTISFALAWIGGVIGGIGVAFGDESVAAVGTATRLLLPTDGLWRGALFALEPGYMVAGASQAGPALAAFPFFVPAGPEVAYLAWCATWVAAMLRLAVLAFERREV